MEKINCIKCGDKFLPENKDEKVCDDCKDTANKLSDLFSKSCEEIANDGECHCIAPERGMGFSDLHKKGYYCKKCRKFREEEKLN